MTTTAAGMAATSLPGAVLMMIGAPHAAADTSATDLVSSSSSSYQPALDQLLDAMQQAVAYDSALPFATPDSDASLLTDLQNTNYELLSAGLGSLLDETVFSTPQSGNGGVGEHARVGPGDREHPARRPRRAVNPGDFFS